MAWWLQVHRAASSLSGWMAPHSRGARRVAYRPTNAVVATESTAAGEAELHGAEMLGDPTKPGAAMPLEEIVDALREMNGADLCVITAPPDFDLNVSHYVVVGGRSVRHVGAIAGDLFKVSTCWWSKRCCRVPPPYECAIPA